MDVCVCVCVLHTVLAGGEVLGARAACGAAVPNEGASPLYQLSSLTHTHAIALFKQY